MPPFTLYLTIPTFNDPENDNFRKHWYQHFLFWFGKELSIKLLFFDGKVCLDKDHTPGGEVLFNSLSNDKILVFSKLKGFAGCKLNVTTMVIFIFRMLEIILGKREN